MVRTCPLDIVRRYHNRVVVARVCLLGLLGFFILVELLLMLCHYFSKMPFGLQSLATQAICHSVSR